MAGKSLTVQEWADITGSYSAGERIVSALVPWHEGLIQFQGSVRSPEYASRKIQEAFSKLEGFAPPDRIRFTSESHVKVLFELLAEQLPFGIEDYLWEAIRKEDYSEKPNAPDFYHYQEFRDLATRLEGDDPRSEGYSPILALPKDLVGSIHSALIATLFGETSLLPLRTIWHPEYEIRGGPHEGAEYTFERLITYHLAFLAVGKLDDAEKIWKLLELYRKGFVFWVWTQENELWVCTG